MKRALTSIQDAYRCWHFVNGERIFGPPPELLGDVTGLRGEVSRGLRGNVSLMHGEVSSDLRGEVSGLWGEVSPDLRGDVTGLRGEVTGLRGDADACELTDADREEGVSVHTLVAESAPERGGRVNTTARRHPRTLAEAWPQHYAWRGVVTRIRRPLIERWSCALGWLSLFGLLAGIGALLAWRG